MRDGTRPAWPWLWARGEWEVQPKATLGTCSSGRARPGGACVQAAPRPRPACQRSLFTHLTKTHRTRVHCSCDVICSCIMLPVSFRAIYALLYITPRLTRTTRQGTPRQFTSPKHQRTPRLHNRHVPCHTLGDARLLGECCFTGTGALLSMAQNLLPGRFCSPGPHMRDGDSETWHPCPASRSQEGDASLSQVCLRIPPAALPSTQGAGDLRGSPAAELGAVLQDTTQGTRTLTWAVPTSWALGTWWSCPVINSS